MLTADRLAVLVPVFNGGERLISTLSSCARAGLSPDRYEIIVVDNCSTDNAMDEIPSSDDRGAAIQVHRNEKNLGRVGNWNRSVAIAREQGFRYITFLFVGDTWLPDGSLPDLLDQVQHSGACIGLSSFSISDEDGETKRHSQRFYVSGRESAIVSSDRFITRLTASGLFPLGPLQANIYRISRQSFITFDADIPTRTDVDATLQFIQNSDRPVVISANPFFQWCEHSSRFHKSMGAGQTIEDYIATFELGCERSGEDIDYGLAKSRLILNSIRLAHNEARPAEWPTLCEKLLRYGARTPHRITGRDMLRALWLRFGRRQRLLEFGPDHEQSVARGEHCVTH